MLSRSFRHCLLGSALVAGSLVSAVHADTLAAWNLGGAAGSETSFAATHTAAGMTASAITRGGGLNPSGLADGLSSNQWSNNDPTGSTPGSPPGTRDDALTNGDFYQASLTVEADTTVSLSTLDVRLRRSGLGAPDHYEWQYSLDGFATAGTTLTTFTYLGRGSTGGGSGISVADNFNYMTVDVQGQGDGNPMPTLDLSTVAALQDLQAGEVVTFRLYGWGADRDSRTVALGRSRPTGTNALAIGGTVSGVPEPASFALLGLGMTALIARRRTA